MQLQTNADLLTEKLYDLSMIEQLCRGNQDQVKKMVKVFIDQIPKSVEEIKLAYTTRDLDIVKNVAHKIKPTLSYYAIVKIEKDLRQIEALAKEGFATTELELKINKLEEITTQVVEKMKQDFLYY
ncbi:Hpt domain-containing protein [Ferruginibacter sp.]|nr:Hpt domain-containing protein [Ferruginibacter sp.]